MSDTIAAPVLVLASGSATRRALLQAAGLEARYAVPRVDEAALRAALAAEGARPRDMADALAEAKARRVAAPPNALVLGADQILALGDTVFGRPADRAEAAAQLRQLRGRRHRLYSAAVIYEDGRPVWRHVDVADLQMRPFSDRFLEDYLDRVGDGVTATVGGYRIEGLGVQLFASIRGDYFTIMGLPLLNLLDYLRLRGVCPA